MLTFFVDRARCFVALFMNLRICSMQNKNYMNWLMSIRPFKNISGSIWDIFDQNLLEIRIKTSNDWSRNATRRNFVVVEKYAKATAAKSNTPYNSICAFRMAFTASQVEKIDRIALPYNNCRRV